jgi:hypothetical protein
MSEEIIVAAEKDTDGLAAVFEFDGEVGYFYLYGRTSPFGKTRSCT